MSKSSVTRLFKGSFIAAVAGATVAIAATWIAIANDVFVMRGADIIGIQGSGLAWVALGVALAGAITFTGGLVGGFVAWIGALLATAQLPRKTWFVALLVLGVFNFGFFGMVAYLLAGPDTDQSQRPASAHTAPAIAGA